MSAASASGAQPAAAEPAIAQPAIGVDDKAKRPSPTDHPTTGSTATALGKKISSRRANDR
jgi:hypothetical protein